MVDPSPVFFSRWFAIVSHSANIASQSSLFTFCFLQRIALQFKANLENLTNVRPDEEDFRWYLKVRKMTSEKNGSQSLILLLQIIEFIFDRATAVPL